MMNKDAGSCAVCNEIASGIHYGVSTCEGCKGFFRRIITTCASDNNTLSCTGPLKNKCIVAFRVRNLCQRCRLQKCFNVGMTRKHSKLGRKRKLEQDIFSDTNRLINLDALLSDGEMNERIQNENTYFLREIGIVKGEDTDTGNGSENDFENRVVLISRDNDTTLNDHVCTDVLSIIDKPVKTMSLEDYYIFSPSLAKFWKRKGQKDMIDEREEETKKLFKSMFPVIRLNDGDTEDLFIQMNNFFYLMNESDEEYIMFQKLRKEIPLAHMSTCTVTIPIMENFYNYKYENIPIDEDPDNVWKLLLIEIDSNTNNVISFFKRIPDFESGLQCADALNIIRLSLFEIISLRFLRLVDLENNQFFDPKLSRKIPSSVMAKNPLGPLFLKYFYAAAFVKKYLVHAIDDFEMAFLSAFCLTLPGWDSNENDFINVSHLNRMRFYCSLCLYDHLLVRRFKGNVDEARKRMRRLYMLLDKIKIINKIQPDILCFLSKNKKTVEGLPEILRRIYFDEFEVSNEHN